mmetsp:Transcript_95729/g.249389  ORF Transcript_95729/g.249389 Transcript_95729/m.249389 type:complete len:231 (+) Transcript_95729:149-841(+)
MRKTGFVQSIRLVGYLSSLARALAPRLVVRSVPAHVVGLVGMLSVARLLVEGGAGTVRTLTLPVRLVARSMSSAELAVVGLQSHLIAALAAALVVRLVASSMSRAVLVIAVGLVPRLVVGLVAALVVCLVTSSMSSAVLTLVVGLVPRIVVGPVAALVVRLVVSHMPCLPLGLVAALTVFHLLTAAAACITGAVIDRLAAVRVSDDPLLRQLGVRPFGVVGCFGNLSHVG